MITKYYNKVMCSYDNPMVSAKDVNERLEAILESPFSKDGICLIEAIKEFQNDLSKGNQ